MRYLIVTRLSEERGSRVSEAPVVGKAQHRVPCPRGRGGVRGTARVGRFGIEPLRIGPLEYEPLGMEHLGIEPLGIEPLGIETLGSESLGSESLGSESLGSESLRLSLSLKLRGVRVKVITEMNFGLRFRLDCRFGKEINFGFGSEFNSRLRSSCK